MRQNSLLSRNTVAPTGAVSRRMNTKQDALAAQQVTLVSTHLSAFRYAPNPAASAQTVAS